MKKIMNFRKMYRTEEVVGTVAINGTNTNEVINIESVAYRIVLTWWIVLFTALIACVSILTTTNLLSN
jgi:hypothetical protein